MNYLSLLVALLCCWAVPASAEILQVSDQLSLQYEVPAGWQVSTSAPEFLILQTVEHVSMHMREEGKTVPENLESMVRERLANNELFLFNPQTRAHLDIDFSPIEVGESDPGQTTIAKSAQYAEQELSVEPDLSGVQSRTSKFILPGADHAYRIDASFRRDDEPRRFVGVIGYAKRHWLFLYYTDEAVRETDLQLLDKTLSGLILLTR